MNAIISSLLYLEAEKSKIMAHLLINGDVSTLNVIENTLSDFIVHTHFLLNSRQFLLKTYDPSGEGAERLKWEIIDYRLIIMTRSVRMKNLPLHFSKSLPCQSDERGHVQIKKPNIRPDIPNLPMFTVARLQLRYSFMCPMCSIEIEGRLTNGYEQWMLDWYE